MTMTIARVQDGNVLEERPIPLSDVPEHKRALWRPIEGEPPYHDSRIHTLSGPMYQIEDARVLRVWVKEDRPLDTVKGELAAAVDETAEQIRAKYATPHAGMVMTYQEKFACANAVDQMGEQAANALSLEEATQRFAVLAASVGVEAPTLWACAQIVVQKYNQWALVANVIERTRLTAKKTINESASVEAALAAFEAVTWTV